MPLIKNLYKSYDNFNINIPYWEILNQGITALWGTSGSGKTSIVRILLGLEPCKNYQWIIDGKDYAQVNIQERKLGVVFQNLEVFPHLSAKENMIFAAKARKINKNEYNKKINELSDILNMHSFLNRKAEVLSGGEKQRLALSRAIIGKPRVLFLDEPFSMLDETIKKEARKLVKKLIEYEAIPSVLISHDKNDIQQLAKKVSIIDNGKIISEYYNS